MSTIELVDTIVPGQAVAFKTVLTGRLPIVAGLPANALDVHVVLAVQLARCMAGIEQHDAKRRRTVDHRRAALLLRIVESLTRQSIALSRCIGLAPSSRYRLADVQAGREAERHARTVAAELAGGRLDGVRESQGLGRQVGGAGRGIARQKPQL